MFIEEQLKQVRAARYSRAAWAAYARAAAARIKTQIWNNPQATRSVLLTGTGIFVFHLLCSLGLSFLLGPERGTTFLWGAGLSTLFITLVCLGHLELIRTTDGVACSALNPADWLSLARFTMAPAAVLFAAWAQWRLALAWIILAGITDILDGAVARWTGGGTVLGLVFDPIVDIAFNVCMFAGLTAAGLIPGWILALVGLRYAIIVFGAIYLYVAKGPVRIQPTIFGKVSGILIHVLLISLVTLGVVGDARLTQRAGAVLELSLAFVCGVTVIHVLGMGWANLKMANEQLAPPQVVADVRFGGPRSRDQ